MVPQFEVSSQTVRSYGVIYRGGFLRLCASDAGILVVLGPERC